MIFKVYQEVKNQPAEVWRHKPPKLVVKAIEAETAYDAAVAFCNARPKGWRDRIIEVRGSMLSKHQTADVWLRRFTPSGYYKGETHFLVWPAEDQ